VDKRLVETKNTKKIIITLMSGERPLTADEQALVASGSHITSKEQRDRKGEIKQVIVVCLVH
jgi:hypothetical protein